MLLVLSFVFFMLLGLPLFGVIGLASIISMIGMPFPMEFIPQNLYTGMDQFPLIATIGFVMAGFLMEPAGITGEIIEVAKKAVGNIRRRPRHGDHPRLHDLRGAQRLRPRHYRGHRQHHDPRHDRRGIPQDDAAAVFRHGRDARPS